MQVVMTDSCDAVTQVSSFFSKRGDTARIRNHESATVHQGDDATSDSIVLLNTSPH
jgi:hypothetical protein